MSRNEIANSYDSSIDRYSFLLSVSTWLILALLYIRIYNLKGRHFEWKGKNPMKPNKILFILLAFNIFSLAFTEAGTAGTFQDVKSRGKLIAGVRPDSPPFGFVDRDGVHKGFDIDLAKALARELFGKEEALELVDVTPANRISFLKEGKVDVLIANMTITDSRKKVIDFSNPYFLSGHLILVRKDSKVTRYQDLAGKKIATLRKSIGYAAVKKLVSFCRAGSIREKFRCHQGLEGRAGRCLCAGLPGHL